METRAAGGLVGSEYVAKAQGNHIREVVEPAIRGEILDASGRVLAGNQTKLVVSVSRTALLMNSTPSPWSGCEPIRGLLPKQPA